MIITEKVREYLNGRATKNVVDHIREKNYEVNKIKKRIYNRNLENTKTLENERNKKV